MAARTSLPRPRAAAAAVAAAAALPASSKPVGSSSCEPTTCEALALDCGKIADGCGEILDCGGCGDGALCGIQESNTCTTLTDLCEPLSEEDACAGKECGFAGDGCEGSLRLRQLHWRRGLRRARGLPVRLGGCLHRRQLPGGDHQLRQRRGGLGGVRHHRQRLRRRLDCTAELGGCAADTYCGVRRPETRAAPVTSSCTPLSPRRPARANAASSRTAAARR